MTAQSRCLGSHDGDAAGSETASAALKAQPDRDFLRGGGAGACLVLDRCPPRICAAAVWAFKPLIDRMWEAFANGSTEVFHDTVRCPDVGVERGGAGEITMRIRAVPKGES